ncbi:class I SAM-dependent methyltransferase [Pleionea sp. CnH1-48]|uniref:class I SAM-dependent methyltransferase n=1 Tax=Pleionea sp. CnH1-48 TaxID=2954494 RepID=UPI002097CFE4|nr:class I SAM-dependent methyltransferase [Pleionea sp. CnH1-48]MCO7225395.1 methyltransferase domain-containing protein [Pleionea sp. CnH1-48]
MSMNKDTTQYFQSRGDDYAKFRPTYPVELAQSLETLVPQHKQALDVGCGNGQLTCLLAPFFEQVVGTDVSANQLQHAASLDNVSYLHQRAEELELPDNSVDLIVVAQAAHWFDLALFYSQVRRVATNHCVIALISYGVPYIKAPVNTIFQQGYWQELHSFWPPERVHVETGYAELWFPFTELELPNHSCQKIMTFEEFVGYIKTWSAYTNAIEQQREDVFALFFERLQNRWPHQQTLEVVWPISVRVGQVFD